MQFDTNKGKCFEKLHQPTSISSQPSDGWFSIIWGRKINNLIRFWKSSINFMNGTWRNSRQTSKFHIYVFNHNSFHCTAIERNKIVFKFWCYLTKLLVSYLHVTCTRLVLVQLNKYKFNSFNLYSLEVANRAVSFFSNFL